MELLTEHLGKGFLDMLLISMPIVLTAAFIGLIIGIIQAVTQVQEQTISAAPKILGVFLVIIVMSGFFTKLLTEYILDSANLAFNVIPKQDDYLLPPEGEEQKLNFSEEKDYHNLKHPSVNEIMKNPGKVPYSDKKQKLSVTPSPGGPMSQPNLLESRKIYSGR